MAMRRLAILASVAFATLTTVPPSIQAQQVDDEFWRTRSDAELRETVADTYSEPCTSGVPAMRELIRRRPEDATLRFFMSLPQMSCAMEREDWPQALVFYRQLQGTGTQASQFLNPLLGLMLAQNAGDGDEAVDQLRRLLVDSRVTVDDRLGEHIVLSVIPQLARSPYRDQLQQIALETARAGRLATVGEGVAAVIAYFALEPAVAQSPELVSDLLQPTQDFDTYVRLLAIREYESIWPQVEARVGPHMGQAIADNLAATRARYDGDPGNATALKEYAWALSSAGRDSEVIDLIEGWRGRPDAPTEINEDLAWAINAQGYAYRALGRNDDARRVMSEIAAVDETTSPWVVNFVINHAALLVDLGDYEDALAASDRAGSVARAMGSGYARLLVAQIRACSLERLGRHEEALAELDYVLANKADSFEVAADAMLCLGQRDEAVAMLMEAFADETVAADYYEMLQSDAFDMYADNPDLPEAADVVRSEPQLRALLERSVREIPSEFAPIRTAEAGN